MRSAGVNFRAAELEAALAARAWDGIHQAAKRAVARYVQVLADEWAALGLSPTEADVLVAILDGCEFTPQNYRAISADLEEALESDPGLAWRYGIDPARLRDVTGPGASPGRLMAMADYVERARHGNRTTTRVRPRGGNGRGE